ncbi:MAG: M28 family peptidase [Candidatus Lokiarchaeota archaeon]|nr:M28 family peptidase [Candidatus Lokiarchaeota archaeon]
MVKNKELSRRVWKDNKIPEGFRQNTMHKFLVKICEEVGPREAGSAAEHKAAEIVKDEFTKYCDDVTKEEFKLAPRAFLSFTIFSPLLFLIGLPFFWIYPIISAITAILAMFIFYMQFLRYAEFVDFFYPKETSVNVIGEINPRDDWKQTLMFSAHLDSAYQFNFNLYMPRTFNYFLVGLPILLVIYILLSLAFFISSWVFNVPGTIFSYFGIGVAIITVPMTSLLFFFKTKWTVMGANDNLSGIAIMQGIAESLTLNKDLVPKNTKILFCAFGSEEAGLRGAKRWVKGHKDELKKKPFYFLNFDGVAKSDDLHVINKEVTLGVQYDPEIVEKVIQAAENIGIPLESRVLPFGATDGSAIVQGGFSKGASLEAMDIEKPEVKRWYHTIGDTADKVESEALDKVRRISLEFINLIDKK